MSSPGAKAKRPQPAPPAGAGGLPAPKPVATTLSGASGKSGSVAAAQTRKAGGAAAAAKPGAAVAVPMSPQMLELRTLSIRLNNASMSEIGSACFKLAKLFACAPSDVRLAAVQRGVLPALAEALADQRPIPLAHAAYAVGQLCRGNKELQAAVIGAGIVPYLARLCAPSQPPHLVFRAVEACAQVVFDQPVAAAAMVTCGVVPWMLEHLQRAATMAHCPCLCHVPKPVAKVSRRQRSTSPSPSSPLPLGLGTPTAVNSSGSLPASTKRAAAPLYVLPASMKFQCNCRCDKWGPESGAKEERWKECARYSKLVEALAISHPPCRGTFVDGGIVAQLGKVAMQAPDRTVRGAAKDALKAIGVPWMSLLSEDEGGTGPILRAGDAAVVVDTPTVPFSDHKLAAQAAHAMFVSKRQLEAPTDVNALLGTSVHSLKLTGQNAARFDGFRSASLAFDDLDDEDSDDEDEDEDEGAAGGRALREPDLSVYSDRFSAVAAAGGGSMAKSEQEIMQANMMAAQLRWKRKDTAMVRARLVKVNAPKAKAATAATLDDGDDGFFGQAGDY